MRELVSEAAGEARERRLYNRDFWAWTQEQAGALRRRDFGVIDWDNLIEEVETLGRSEKSAWTSHCKNVISHLLKIEYSPATGSIDHWREEIEEWRGEMYEALADNPGMKGEISEMLRKAWMRGCRAAVKKLAGHTRPGGGVVGKAVLRELQQRLPQECPYSLVEIAGYDPFDKQAEPEPDVWPAAVVRVMNEELGTDYPVRH